MIRMEWNRYIGLIPLPHSFTINCFMFVVYVELISGPEMTKPPSVYF